MGLDSLPVSQRCRNNFSANKVNVNKPKLLPFYLNLYFLMFKYCLISSIRSMLK